MTRQPSINYDLLRQNHQRMMEAEHDETIVDPYARFGSAALAYLEHETVYDEVDAMARFGEPFAEVLAGFPLTDGTARYELRNGARFTVSKHVGEPVANDAVTTRQRVSIDDSRVGPAWTVSRSQFSESDFEEVRIDFHDGLHLAFSRDALAKIWRIREPDTDLAATRRTLAQAGVMMRNYVNPFRRLSKMLASDIHGFTLHTIETCHATNVSSLQANRWGTSFNILLDPGSKQISFTVASHNTPGKPSSSVVTYGYEAGGNLVIEKLYAPNLDMTALAKTRRSLANGTILRHIFNW